jgi:hypothetical protein
LKNAATDRVKIQSRKKSVSYNYRDGLQSGTISIGTNALANLFREFILK